MCCQFMSATGVAFRLYYLIDKYGLLISAIATGSPSRICYTASALPVAYDWVEP